MSRCLTRISLTLVLLLSGQVWAIGLGDIRLDSALNEPLRAEIELLSATPEELASLSVTLASAETFARYGIDRPYYLQTAKSSRRTTSSSRVPRPSCSPGCSLVWPIWSPATSKVPC